MSLNPTIMKTLLTIAASAFFILASVRCQPTEIRQSMAHFDQAFLPVMMHAYEGNLPQAKRAVFYLDFQWQKMRNRHEFARGEVAWTEAFQRIQTLLGEAYRAIDDNRPQAALARLEGVKKEFIALRERYGIDYYLDYLYDFQASADLLTETSQDEMLCLLQWDDLEQMAQDVNDAWRDVLTQPVELELYELNAEKLTLLRRRMQAMTKLMDVLNKAVETANRAEVEKVCRELQPTFLQILWVFGNNAASTTYYVQRQKSQENINLIIR